MKAAVLHNIGDSPRFENFEDPVPGKDDILLHVKAVTLENVDQMMAAGKHFASSHFLSALPAIVGLSGVGEREDRQLVGFSGMKAPYGAMAEKVVVPKDSTVIIPEGVHAETAAAVPSAALTSLLPLQWNANIKPGASVLINGATGVAGKLAVQIAQLLGAERIVGTGRNDITLKRIKELGANEIIDLKQSEEKLITSFKQEFENGVDVILDFLWGSPTELITQAIKPKDIQLQGHKTRLIQIGEKAGSEISLPAGALRTSGLEISGATASITPEAIQEGTNTIWSWIKEDKLQMDLEIVPLEHIESVWERTDFQGKRIVITP